ncbi:MAG: tetratricopeptide repeat protein [Bradymonadia bacterium]
MTRILLIHDQSAARERLQDLFAEKDEITLTSAADLDGARQHLHDARTPFDALLIRWSLADHQALKLLSTVRPNRSTRLLAFNPQWHPHDLRQAFHLGVEAFFTEPLEPGSVLAELRIMERLSKGMTRARLLMQEPVSLLEPQRRLWSGIDDPVWASRMATRAEQVLMLVQEEHEARVTRVKTDLERAIIDGAPLTTSLTLGVCAALRSQDPDLVTIAEEHGTELATLDTLVEALEADMADEIEQEVHRPELIWAVESLAVELDQKERESTQLDALGRLRTQGQAMVEASAPTPDVLKGFISALIDVMQFPLTELGSLSPDQLKDLARHACCDDLELGLVRIRVTLLGHSLRDIPQSAFFSLEPDRFKALASVFGTQPNRIGDALEEIKDVLAAVDPGVTEPLPDLSKLRRIARNMKHAVGVPGVSSDRLKAVLLSLADAGEPDGELDTRRISALHAQIEMLLTARVSRSVLYALGRAMAAAEEDEAHPLGATSKQIGALMRPQGDPQLPDEINQWAMMPQNQRPTLLAMSARGARLGAAAAPAAPAPSAPAPAPAPAPPAAEPEAAPAQSAPQQSPPAQAQRPGRGNHRTAPKHQYKGPPELVAFLEEHSNDLTGILAHLRDLKSKGDDGTLKQLRQMLGLRAGPSTTQDVRRLMGESRLDGAYVAAQELTDEDQKTAPMLNEVALSLRVFGHVQEGAELFERATRLQPNRPSLLFNYARIKIELGHYEEAMELLERVIKLAPDLKAAKALLFNVRKRLQARSAAS